MSLTQAITLNVDGSIFDKFGTWSRSSYKSKKTIFHAIEAYTVGNAFEFQVDKDFVYEIHKDYYFVPAVEELYWLELDVVDKTRMQGFVRDLLAKMAWSVRLPKYEYALFDCPPSFTLLSYSVLSVCDLILIPVNPDLYAVRGVPLILNTLQRKIQPFPIPRIGVFMNRAKPYAGGMTKESRFYWGEVQRVCEQTAAQSGLRIECFETPIYERVAIKRAVGAGGVPGEYIHDFNNLWTAITRYVNE